MVTPKKPSSHWSRGLRRFYVDRAFSSEESTLRLSPHETFHLHRVLRLRAGDRCQILNRNGLAALAVVEAISETEGAQVRFEKIFPLKEKSLRIKVAQAIPQKKQMDDLVEKAVELGVEELWVLETKRTVVKMTEEARERTRKRWERIVIGAAKQSGSSVFTQVTGPISFEKVLEEKLKPNERTFLFHPAPRWCGVHPDPEGLPFSTLIDELVTVTQKGDTHLRPAIFLFFGPEGGFTGEEVRFAESRGVRKVFLGDSILRIETAFLGVLSAIRLLT